MLVSINSTNFKENDIRITATNLETILLSDDLFKKIDETEEDEVTFVFDVSNIRHKKYLYKLCQSQRSAKDQKSLGEMIEALKGCILSISNNFLE